jgi:ATP-dependent RNA helicase RhlE
MELYTIKIAPLKFKNQKMNYNKKNIKSQKSKRRPVSQINPESLVKKASQIEHIPYVSELNFSELNLHSQLSRNIAKKGYSKPTEIQEKCINSLIAGKNLIGIAATGTGKTAAFLIPIIHQMLEDASIMALVVLPTRELAQQVETEFKGLTNGTTLNSSCFIGGTSVGKDISNAKRKNRLIVGTPGRINDLIDRNALRLNNTTTLVIDEFDRMLDMGFIKDIQRVVLTMKNRKQTMLFSATKDSTQEKLIQQIIEQPVRVNTTSGTRSSDNVDQNIIKVGNNESKYEVLLNLIGDSSFNKVILFAETKRMVDKLSKQLVKSGVKTDVIHGNKSQSYRSKAISLFKRGKVKVLVATDVAARGIDIKGITHVVNYQLPQTMDSYIHRIGRTGRAGATGTAYTFIN